MAVLTQYGQKAVLDYLLGGATPTRPGALWISFATGTPNADGASDGPVNSRMSLDMAAAQSGGATAGSATNRSARSNASATAACNVFGWNLWDAAAAGNRLAYGTMTAAFSVTSGSNILMSAGRVRINLS